MLKGVLVGVLVRVCGGCWGVSVWGVSGRVSACGGVSVWVLVGVCQRVGVLIGVSVGEVSACGGVNGGVSGGCQRGGVA